MSSVNKAIVVGNVGKDPKVSDTRNGGRYASFSVATSERWKDKDSGERNQVTHWHNVIVFQKDLVEFAEKHIRKGTKVYVEGSMQTRKWQDGGVDKYMTEVVVKGFGCQLMLAEGQLSASASAGAGSRDSPVPDESDYGTTAGPQEGTPRKREAVDDLDGEVPF